MTDAPIKFRRALDRDMPLVYNSWLLSFRLEPAAGMLPMDLYYEPQRKALGRVVGRPRAEVWVAYDPEEPNPRYELRGWAVVERGFRGEIRWQGKTWRYDGEIPIVHYVYAKELIRRAGVGRALLVAAGLDLKERMHASYQTAAWGRFSSGLRLRTLHAPWITRSSQGETDEEDPASGLQPGRPRPVVDVPEHGVDARCDDA